MKRTVLAVLVGMLSLNSGCATILGASRSQLQIGMPQEEVVQIFGTPASAGKVGPHTVWCIHHGNILTRDREYVVIKNGAVSFYSPSKSQAILTAWLGLPIDDFIRTQGNAPDKTFDLADGERMYQFTMVNATHTNFSGYNANSWTSQCMVSAFADSDGDIINIKFEGSTCNGEAGRWISGY